MMTLQFKSAANPQLRQLAKTLRRDERAARRRVISVSSLVAAGILSAACGPSTMMMDGNVTDWVSGLTELAATAIHIGLIVLSAVMNAG
jgi:hypothetical protein